MRARQRAAELRAAPHAQFVWIDVNEMLLAPVRVVVVQTLHAPTLADARRAVQDDEDGPGLWRERSGIFNISVLLFQREDAAHPETYVRSLAADVQPIGFGFFSVVIPRLLVFCFISGGASNWHPSVPRCNSSSVSLVHYDVTGGIRSIPSQSVWAFRYLEDAARRLVNHRQQRRLRVLPTKGPRRRRHRFCSQHTMRITTSGITTSYF